ncbi:DUF1015 family protein [Nocardioides sp. CPCC 205120]|uniref:DUF1015 family protein n=1 Tax=Nocardioides sp. CPCC 205120 TaxID=3406462 RepID=UPI003B50D67A
MEPDDVTIAPAVGPPVELHPFAATRLSPGRVGDPASARLLARPHRAVPERIQRWRRLGNLVQDERPALYVHEYSSQGLAVRAVVGLASVHRAAATLAGPGIVPHEDVDRHQAEELAARMHAMRVNPAPILLAHRAGVPTRDLVDAATLSRPLTDYVDRAGQRHRFWAVTEESAIAELAASFRDARLLVADGHHRLAAYQLLDAEESEPGWDRGLVMAVDQSDTPLFLGAIHRVLHGVDASDLVGAVRRLGIGELRDLGDASPVVGLDQRTLVITTGERSWAVTVPESSPFAPVEVLHRELLPHVPEHRVEFHHTAEAALARLTSPARGVEERTVVLVPALTYDAVDAVVAAGRRLPEKATSFQPKSSIGAIMRSF